MAINLYATADPTVTTAVEKAAMSNVPRDYSGAMQYATQSYSNMLYNQGQMWSNLGKAAAGIGLAIHKDIKTVPPEGTDIIIGDLDKTQDKMKISYGLMIDPVTGKRMNPFSKEARKLRAETRSERERMFAEAEYELEGLKTIQSAHDSGLVDSTMTGFRNMEMSHAAIATSRGKATNYGNYFKWEDIDGARKWVLYHDPKQINEAFFKENPPPQGLPSTLTAPNLDKDGRVLDANNQIIATTTAEIAQNLRWDKLGRNGVGVTKTAKSTAAQKIQQMGFNSSVPFEQLDSYQMSSIEELINSQKNDVTSWHVASYADPNLRSFYNRVTNADKKGPSAISANIFSMLSQVSGYEFVKGKGIKVKDGPLANLEGAEDGYISEKELNLENNIKQFGLNLFGGAHYDPELTAALYETDAKENYKNLFNNGHSKRTSSTDGGITMNTGVYYRTGQGNQKELGSDIIAKYTPFVKGQPFKSYDGKHSFEISNSQWQVTGPTDPDKDGSWDGPVKTRPISQYNLAEMMGFNNQAHMLGFDPSKLSTIGGKDDENEDLNEAISGTKDDKPGTMLSRILNPSKYFEFK